MVGKIQEVEWDPNRPYASGFNEVGFNSLSGFSAGGRLSSEIDCLILFEANGRIPEIASNHTPLPRYRTWFQVQKGEDTVNP